MLWGVVPERWLSSSVKVSCYAHSLIDLTCDVSSSMVRADGVMTHARDSMANALNCHAPEHLYKQRSKAASDRNACSSNLV